MCGKSDNIEVNMCSEKDKIIEELFNSFLQRYQKKKKKLEESMRGSEFVFARGNSLYYKLHIVSLNREGSYIDSPEWLKNKKTKINLKNNNDKCFQYALTVALNYQNIQNNPKRI